MMAPSFLLFLCPPLILLLLVFISLFLHRRAFIISRNDEIKRTPRTTTIGVFHPYANGGGGGERVLFCALLALIRKYQKLNINLRILLYAGDDGLSAAELVAKAADDFNLQELRLLNVERHVKLISLPSREILEPSRYPSFTLLWQSLAHIRLALEAVQQSSKQGLYPQLWVDTTGCPFSYIVASLLYACTVVAYVHYPMISTDMISKVQQRGADYNNDANIASSSSRSSAKYVYYSLFAKVYSLVGKYCTDVVMVNSTWTYNHIKQLWGKAPTIVYPPCGAMQEYVEFSLENRELIALSVSQFRPEKNHLLQLQLFQKLLMKYDTQMKTRFSNFRLVLLGSCRNAEDIARVEKLKMQAKELGIADRVDFVVNASFAVLKQFLAKSSIGIHTMFNEHFGISIVEMMAAGMLVVANNSGGPKADIVRPDTGLLALTADEYAAKVLSLLEKSPSELVEMRSAARRSSLRFSDNAFGEQFIAAVGAVI
ncbi:putative glycosyl transferase, family 1, ALG11 mannosyltransferase [Plasmopara halstedii]